ncbi:hypothetical protein, partial [Mesorhizobium sp. M1273]|uniref:hypothetical protein n=1 Tax=Mesorhizobium sp. M1273 TaxID=2957075 RepID=UPI00333DE3F1
FLLIFFHHKVSTYFGGHLMHQSTQQQKVRGNSRLPWFRQTDEELVGFIVRALDGREIAVSFDHRCR